MNAALWVGQVLLALHTIMGATWKISHSEQAVPSLQAIPHAAWLSLIGIEILLGVALVLPALQSKWAKLAPAAAACIALEMLAFVALHLASKHGEHGPMMYWLVVAVFCAFLTYARLSLRPLA